MLQILKLLRWPNLVIIIISMMLIQFCVINPLLGVEAFYAGMTALEFTLLILATVLITIGGYLINDYFDIDVDRLNKPGKNQVGMKFPVATVQILYWLFTVSGVLLGIILSWMLNQINYSLIFVFSAGLLWFYSERYQCIPLVGNLVVAFLSALSFGLVWLFGFFSLSNDAAAFTTVQASFPLVNKMVLMYMGFAFITSLFREVTKDMEDAAGDERFGCRTFAVAFGMKKAKMLGIFIALIGLASSIYFQVFAYRAEFFMLFGSFLLIDLLFGLSIFWLLKAENKVHFKRLSTFIKVLMLLGILSMVLVYFEV